MEPTYSQESLVSMLGHAQSMCYSIFPEDRAFWKNQVAKIKKLLGGQSND